MCYVEYIMHVEMLNTAQDSQVLYEHRDHTHSVINII